MNRILLFVALAWLHAFTASAETLTVSVGNLRSVNGTVRIALFTRDSGFPAERNAFAKMETRISSRSVRAVFTNIPAGIYSVAAYHDENRNQIMDVNLLGIPTEGYGFSNNARGILGAPRFEAAAVSVNGALGTVSILVGY